MTNQNCSHPCKDYPCCPCVPDTQEYFQEVEREELEFSRNPCPECGGEFGECFCCSDCGGIGAACECGEDNDLQFIAEVPHGIQTIYIGPTDSLLWENVQPVVGSLHFFRSISLVACDRCHNEPCTCFPKCCCIEKKEVCDCSLKSKIVGGSSRRVKDADLKKLRIGLDIANGASESAIVQQQDGEIIYVFKKPDNFRDLSNPYNVDWSQSPYPQYEEINKRFRGLQNDWMKDEVRDLTKSEMSELDELSEPKGCVDTCNQYPNCGCGDFYGESPAISFINQSFAPLRHFSIIPRKFGTPNHTDNEDNLPF